MSDSNAKRDKIAKIYKINCDDTMNLEEIAKDLAQCLHEFRKWAYHNEDCNFEEIDEDEPCSCGSNKLCFAAHIAIETYSDFVRKAKTTPHRTEDKEGK